jgi:predicted P-loop ATPase
MLRASVTLVRSATNVCTKTIHVRDDDRLEVLNFSAGTEFTFSTQEHSLASLVEFWKNQPPDSYFVHGAPRVEHGRRRHVGAEAELADAPVNGVWIDVDNIPLGSIDPLDITAQAAEARKHLPDGFRNAACAAGGTTKSGTPLAEGRIKLRLFFLLETPQSLSLLKKLFKTAPVDTSLYTPSQPIYAAAPIYVGGVDPFVAASRPRVVLVPGEPTARVGRKMVVLGGSSTEEDLIASVSVAENKHNALNAAAYNAASARLAKGQLLDGLKDALLAALASNPSEVKSWEMAGYTIDKAFADAGVRKPVTVKLALAADENGNPLATQANVTTLCYELAEYLAYDERANRPLIMRRPPWMSGEGEWVVRTITDGDEGKLVKYFSDSRNYPRAGTKQVVDGLTTVLTDVRRLDPVRDYLESLLLSENASEIAETWLIKYAGAADSPYIRAVSKRWLISGVARTFEPGCVAREVLTLLGTQNKGKSSLLRNLCPDPKYFRDDLSFRNEDSPKRGLAGKWIIELAEIDKWLRQDRHGDLKAFISSTVDTYDVKYQRHENATPRRVIIAATTNEEEPFSDQTGNSRYNVVRVSDRIDFAGVARDRDTIWGAAVALYKAGEPWHLQEAEQAMAEEVQEAHRYKDSTEEWLIDFLETPHPKDANLFEMEPDQLLPDRRYKWVNLNFMLAAAKQAGVRTDSHRLAGAFARLGWKRTTPRTIDGGRTRRWVRK